ncbi:MAG: TetR/AcrR family transcriptional regulator [Geminicoccales bacterium]
MARPKTYERKEAVERACHAFWAHGYTALGVRELEKLTGLNKFAIRSEFGGKEGLYVEALRYYAKAANAVVLAPMRVGGIETIDAFFKGLVTKGCMNCSRFGCLIVNTGIENAELKRPALRTASDDYWSLLSQHFEKALRYSIEKGEIDRMLDTGETSRGLVTAVMGIHTMNRISSAHDGGAALVNMVRSLITSWRT